VRVTPDGLRGKSELPEAVRGREATGGELNPQNRQSAEAHALAAKFIRNLPPSRLPFLLSAFCFPRPAFRKFPP
jgi:hypothetical protein